MLVTLGTHRVNRVLLDSVPDPDLEIGVGGKGGGGGSHLDPEIRGPSLPKNFFGPLGLSLV